MPQPFYCDPLVFRWDLQQIWTKSWLCAAHSCEMKNPGDFVTREIGSEALVLVRGNDGQLHVFYNVCRHRGAQLCLESRGHVKKFVCPYHQWTYERCGSLHICPEMGSEFRKEDYGLIPVAVHEVAGLVFVCLGENPPDFSQAKQQIETQLHLHGLAQAKMACEKDYEVNANWKLIFENNRECYHCQAHHPEYVRATNDTLRDEAADNSDLAALIDEKRQQWAAMGLDVSTVNVSSNMTADWFRANRTPLRRGYVTESLDGQPVAPLMGQLPDFDTGTARITTFPNFWCHANSDHAVSTRLIPISAQKTRIVVTWLVHANAQEGRDYHLDRLLPLWQRTSEQDWRICENQQNGVSSSGYRPGPYVPGVEDNVKRFTEWYWKRLQYSY